MESDDDEADLHIVSGAMVLTSLLPEARRLAWCCWRGPWIAWQGSLVGEIWWKDSCMLLRFLVNVSSSFCFVGSLHVFLRSCAMGMGTVWFEQELCVFEVKQVSKCSILWVYQRTVGVTTSYQSTTQQLLVVAQLALVGDAILLGIHATWIDLF